MYIYIWNLLISLYHQWITNFNTFLLKKNVFKNFNCLRIYLPIVGKKPRCVLWRHKVFSDCCLCGCRQEKEEMPAPVTPTICWTSTWTLSPHLPPSLCPSHLWLFIFHSLSLSLSLSLCPISLILSVFSCVALSFVLSWAPPFVIMSFLSWGVVREQWPAGFHKESESIKSRLFSLLI